jgi:hypothetical protein
MFCERSDLARQARNLRRSTAQSSIRGMSGFKMALAQALIDTQGKFDQVHQPQICGEARPRIRKQLVG